MECISHWNKFEKSYFLKIEDQKYYSTFFSSLLGSLWSCNIQERSYPDTFGGIVPILPEQLRFHSTTISWIQSRSSLPHFYFPPIHIVFSRQVWISNIFVILLFRCTIIYFPLPIKYFSKACSNLQVEEIIFRPDFLIQSCQLCIQELMWISQKLSSRLIFIPFQTVHSPQ